MKEVLLIILFFSLISCSTADKSSSYSETGTSNKKSDSAVEKNQKKGNDSGKALYEAVVAGEKDKALQLITDGSDVNFVSERGSTPLMWAAQKGYADLCEALIKKGADVKAKDGYSGEPVLMWAVKKGHYDIALLLIKNGASANSKDNYGQTPLMDASRYGHLKIAELLAAKGADANAISESGETALMFAAGNSYLDIVKFLVSKGANINVISNDLGESALARASKAGFNDIVKYISSIAEEEGTPMKREYKRGDAEITGRNPSKAELESAWAGKQLPKYLSNEDINGQMLSYLNGIKECYRTRIEAGDKNLIGRMNMDLRIAGNGAVLDVILTDEKYQSTFFGDCIIESIKSKPFKMFREEQMNFNYYYTF